MREPPTRWELRYDGPLPRNTNDHRHYGWRARHQHDQFWKNWTGIRVAVADIPPCERIRVELVVRRRNLNVADEDGDLQRMKPLLDGLVAAGVVPKDTRRYVELVLPREEHGASGFTLIVERLA